MNEGKFQKAKGCVKTIQKIEYLRCNFSGNEQHDDPKVIIGEDVVASTDKFKYLGSIIQSNREIDGGVTHYVKVGWLKWRTTTRVLCDRKLPISQTER